MPYTHVLVVYAGTPGRALTDGARGLGCDAIVIPVRSGRLAEAMRRDRVPRALRRRTHCEVLVGR